MLNSQSWKVFCTDTRHQAAQIRPWFEVAKTSGNRLRKVKNTFPNVFIYEKITLIGLLQRWSDGVSSAKLSYSTTPTVFCASLSLFDYCSLKIFCGYVDNKWMNDFSMRMPTVSTSPIGQQLHVLGCLFCVLLNH